MPAEPTIWDRLERGLAQAPTQTPTQATAKDDSEPLSVTWQKLRRRLRFLDVVAALLWVFAFIKIFVFDLDRAFLNAVGLGYLLDYRAFFYLLLLVVTVVVFRAWVFLILPYILFFPLIVLLWKIPAFFIRRRSFLLALAAVQGAVNLFSGFRYNIIAKGCAAFSILFILVSHNTLILAISAIYLGLLIVLSYARLFRSTFSPSAFLETQRNAISNLLKSDRIDALTTIDEEYLESSLEAYDYGKANQLAVKMSYGVIVDRFLYIWAYQLDRYRREVSPALMFNGLSFVWLFFGTILSLSFINYAIYGIDSQQFSVEAGGANLLRFVLYSFANLVLQEAGGVHAIGSAAQALQLVAAILGIIVIAGFVLNVIFTYRHERSESELQDLISTLRSRAHELELRFREQYSVTVNEAHQHLAELRAGLAFVFTYLTAAIPEEFLKARD
jgi:hypothetical protein